MDESTKRNILNLLIRSNQELTINSDGFIELANIAKHYREKLIELSLLRQRRAEEKQNKLNRTPYSKLKRELRSDDYSLDNINVVNILHLILNEKPDLQYLEYKGIGYFWSIENACYILTDQKDMATVIYRLLEVLLRLVYRTDEIYKKTIKAEEIGDRNSKNATRAPSKLEDLKKHEKYPELEAMIKAYKETSREVREINRLIGDILEDMDFQRNRVTIRRYRHLLFDDIKSG